MPGPSPLEYGEYYHIFNRGNNRDNVFVEERNYRHFLRLYARYIDPVADTYAYCLLRNHLHFLVRIKTEEEQTVDISQTLKVLRPSQQFGNLFNAYTKAMNKAYGRTGSLFQNPFGRRRVATDAHFDRLIAYIHQNPEIHGLVDDFRDWPHSSYGAIRSTRETKLKRSDVLEWFGGVEGYEALHEHDVARRQVAPLVTEDWD